MIIEQAVVVRRHGEKVELEVRRDSACGHCDLKQGCGTGAIGRLLGGRRRPLVLTTGLALNPGDRVEIGLAEGALARASLLVYGIPLAGLLAGGLLGAGLDLAEGLVALMAFGGFGAGYALGAPIARSLALARMTPHISKIEMNPRPVPGS